MSREREELAELGVQFITEAWLGGGLIPIPTRPAILVELAKEYVVQLPPEVLQQWRRTWGKAGRREVVLVPGLWGPGDDQL